MRELQTDHPSELLVGAATGDDAAVWRLDEDRALVTTADFITPVVDDARTWGRVAAANSVSDIYAMGGRPLFALNLVGWNVDVLPTSLLGEVLAGGQDIAMAAGFAVVGGHTIDDPEPKYGMAVTGEVHPDRILTNAGLRPGQDIVLTKPLGPRPRTSDYSGNAFPDPFYFVYFSGFDQAFYVLRYPLQNSGCVTECSDLKRIFSFQIHKN